MSIRSRATALRAAAAQPVDVATSLPRGRPCDACGGPVEPGDRFCPSCGAASPGPAANAAVAPGPAATRLLRCEGCGAEIQVDSRSRSYACPFCESPVVVEFTPQTSARQRPEFVIGFSIPPEQAREMFRRWFRRRHWFRPRDLERQAVADRLQGIYLPFWSFSMLAESQWQAEIGEYWYRTETYTTIENGKTVTRTRQVQETEWWPLSGQHHCYHSGYLVSASRSLSQDEADRVLPFQLPALKRFEPYFLAGWMSEEYTVPRDEALRQCEDEYRRRAQAQVAAFLPGDTSRRLQVRTRFSRQNSDLCLLPLYVLSYRYGERRYRFLLNGQTGRMYGEKPFLWGRLIWLLVVIGVAIGAAALVSQWFR